MKLDPTWLTFGLTDEQVKGVAIVFWRSVVIGQIIVAYGGLAFLGIAGFARADEHEKLAGEQRVAEQKLNTILQLQLSERIRALSYERCMVVGHEAKAKKSNEIETWQIEYRRITGERYPEPAC